LPGQGFSSKDVGVSGAGSIITSTGRAGSSVRPAPTITDTGRAGPSTEPPKEEIIRRVEVSGPEGDRTVVRFGGIGPASDFEALTLEEGERAIRQQTFKATGITDKEELRKFLEKPEQERRQIILQRKRRPFMATIEKQPETIAQTTRRVGLDGGLGGAIPTAIQQNAKRAEVIEDAFQQATVAALDLTKTFEPPKILQPGLAADDRFKRGPSIERMAAGAKQVEKDIETAAGAIPSPPPKELGPGAKPEFRQGGLTIEQAKGISDKVASDVSTTLESIPQPPDLERGRAAKITPSGLSPKDIREISRATTPQPEKVFRAIAGQPTPGAGAIAEGLKPLRLRPPAAKQQLLAAGLAGSGGQPSPQKIAQAQRAGLFSVAGGVEGILSIPFAPAAAVQFAKDPEGSLQAVVETTAKQPERVLGGAVFTTLGLAGIGQVTKPITQPIVSKVKTKLGIGPPKPKVQPGIQEAGAKAVINVEAGKGFGEVIIKRTKADPFKATFKFTTERITDEVTAVDTILLGKKPPTSAVLSSLVGPSPTALPDEAISRALTVGFVQRQATGLKKILGRPGDLIFTAQEASLKRLIDLEMPGKLRLAGLEADIAGLQTFRGLQTGLQFGRKGAGATRTTGTPLIQVGQLDVSRPLRTFVKGTKGIATKKGLSTDQALAAAATAADQAIKASTKALAQAPTKAATSGAATPLLLSGIGRLATPARRQEFEEIETDFIQDVGSLTGQPQLKGQSSLSAQAVGVLPGLGVRVVTGTRRSQRQRVTPGQVQIEFPVSGQKQVQRQIQKQRRRETQRQKQIEKQKQRSRQPQASRLDFRQAARRRQALAIPIIPIITGKKKKKRKIRKTLRIFRVRKFGVPSDVARLAKDVRVEGITAQVKEKPGRPGKFEQEVKELNKRYDAALIKKKTVARV
jgi:hypothetical protein